GSGVGSGAGLRDGSAVRGSVGSVPGGAAVCTTRQFQAFANASQCCACCTDVGATEPERDGSPRDCTRSIRVPGWLGAVRKGTRPRLGRTRKPAREDAWISANEGSIGDRRPDDPAPADPILVLQSAGDLFSLSEFPRERA